jgi:PAS domain S-box-containing protein
VPLRPLGIRARLVVLALVVLTPFAAQVAWTAMRQLEARLGERAGEAAARAERLRARLDGAAERLFALLEDARGDRARLEQRLRGQPDYVRALAVLDARGRVVESVSRDEAWPKGLELSGRGLFERGGGAFHVSDPFPNPHTSSPSVLVGRETHAGDGVTLLELDVELLRDALGLAASGEFGEVFVFGRNGAEVTQGDASRAGVHSSAYPPMPALGLPAGDWQFRGERYIVGQAKAKHFPWTIMVAEPRAAVLSQARARQLGTLGAWLAALVASLLLSMWIGRRIARPLESLETASARIAGGDYGHRVPVKGAREIASLAERFNRMAARLESDREALRHSEERFRHLAAMASDYFWETDREHRLSWMAGNLSPQPWGKADGLLGKARWEIPATSPVEISWDEHRRVLAAHAPFRHVLLRRDHGAGDSTYVVISGEPMFDAAGAFAGYRGVGIDITGQKLLREERDRLFERLEILLRRTPAGCVIQGPDLRILGVNPAYERMLGWSAGEAIGGHPFDLHVVPEERDETEALYRRLAAGEMPAERDCVVLTRDARRLHVAWTYTPLVRKDGTFLGVIGMFRDITKIVQAERALVQANLELEARVRQRTAALTSTMKEMESLTYTIAHDLRAPLRAIDGFSGMLAEQLAGGLDAESAELFALIRKNSQRMAELIDDLLGFAQLGRQEMERTSVDLKKLAREVAASLQGAYPRSLIEIGELPGVAGDRALLWQVMLNLMDNGLKFSAGRDHPRVQVHAERSDSEVVLTVQDNGVGFDPNFAHRLFGVFQRLHGESEFEGTGIGLATVQRIAERHGGRAWAESELGKGARVCVALPAAES